MNCSHRHTNLRSKLVRLMGQYYKLTLINCRVCHMQLSKNITEYIYA